jgi:hypothetical protein
VVVRSISETVGARAISTVLDASLCLLLVGASAATLAGTPVANDPADAVGPDTADRAADLLTTSTASVSYEVEASAEPAARSHTRNRTVHDTLAGLLASAARADARSARRPAAAPTPFVAAVTARVGRALRGLDVRRRPPDVAVQVVARSAGVPRRSRTRSDAARGGRVVAGTPPPPDADVHAAGFAVRGVRFTVRTWSR